MFKLIFASVFIPLTEVLVQGVYPGIAPGMGLLFGNLFCIFLVLTDICIAVEGTRSRN